MKLYHGTTGKVAKLALTEGLKPRIMTGSNGNWNHTVSSRDDLIYLTTTYAPYFAHTATPESRDEGDKEDHLLGIVEIDLLKLDEDMLLPDEDFLEQSSRNNPPTGGGNEGLAECSTMVERTNWYKEHLEFFAHHWVDSIERMGVAAYLGIIPPSAITQVSLYDDRSNPSISLMALDPSITLINHLIMGDKYKALTRWFMGGEVRPQDLSIMPVSSIDTERWTEVVKATEGLRIISNT